MDKISYYLFYCQTSNKKTMEKNEHFIQVCNYFFTGKQQVPAGEQPRLIFVFGSPGAGKSTNIKPLLLKFAPCPGTRLSNGSGHSCA